MCLSSVSSCDHRGLHVFVRDPDSCQRLRDAQTRFLIRDMLGRVSVDLVGPEDNRLAFYDSGKRRPGPQM